MTNSLYDSYYLGAFVWYLVQGIPEFWSAFVDRVQFL